MASQINASNSGFGGIVSTGDSSGVLQLQTTGTTAVTIDTSQNVGIGTTSPVFATGGGLSIYNAAAARIKLGDSTSGIGSLDGVELIYDNDAYLFNRENTALIFGTNNTERMRIDSSGRVTMPYQPAYKIGLAAGSVAQNATLNQSNVSQQTGRDEFNVGSHYNHTTGLFTAPVAGTYFFAFQFMRDGSAAGQPAIRYTKNGTSTNMWARCYSSAYYGNFQSQTLITTTKLASGDNVRLFNTDPGPTSIYGDDSYVMGYLIG